MKRILRRLKRSSKFARVTWVIISLAYLISYIFFSKSVISLSGVETFIRYLILVLLLAYFIFYMYECLLKLLQRKYKVFTVINIISFILVIVFSIGAYSIDWLIGKLGNFGESDQITYTSYLITMKNTTLNAKSTFGMIDDNNDIEGNILAKKIIDKYELDNEVEMYDNEDNNAYYDMLYDLYEHRVDGIFVSSNYVTLFSGEEDFINIAEETKVVYQYSEKYKNEDKMLGSANKKLTEPFTVLVMGVDSERDGLDANAAFNGDTLILVTFNPETLNATMFSLPRDIYVPIACRGNKNAKINSSAGSGTECVIKTIENLTDVKIDYYAKINFKGVVSLVDAVGGVTVDVEEPDYLVNHGFQCGGKVCEQDSNRRWGEYTRYITPGVQKLNGEDALAYARCRGLYTESDLARNRHQQDIILALAQEMVKIESLSDFKKILNAVSKNIATNMSTNQILSSYKILKSMVKNVINDQDFISIQKTKLQVYSLPVYVPNTGRYTSALGYYQSSLDDIISAMKVNLELEDYEIVKTMKYSLNENYEAYVAGSGAANGKSNSTLSSMVGSSKQAAENYCSENNIKCTFTFIDETSQYYNKSYSPNSVAEQNPHAGTLMKNVNSVQFYIIGATTKEIAKNTEEKRENINTQDEDKTEEKIVQEDEQDTPSEHSEKEDDSEQDVSDE